MDNRDVQRPRGSMGLVGLGKSRNRVPAVERRKGGMGRGEVGTSLGLNLEGLSGHGKDLDFAPRVTGSLWKVLRLT